jgi:hypothetical protein
MAITTVPVSGIRLLMQMLRKQDSLRVPQIRDCSTLVELRIATLGVDCVCDERCWS